jgi:hypothetical protein
VGNMPAAAVPLQSVMCGFDPADDAPVRSFLRSTVMAAPLASRLFVYAPASAAPSIPAGDFVADGDMQPGRARSRFGNVFKYDGSHSSRPMDVLMERTNVLASARTAAGTLSSPFHLKARAGRHIAVA